MRNGARRIAICCSIILPGAVAFATSNGGPIARTGAPVDGGLTCTQCHNQFAPPVNQGNGRVLVSVNAYSPGITQSLNVQVVDSAALYWGFQLTARLASDETQQAGTFTPNSSINVYCASGGVAPCNGAVEFATQSATATGGGTRGQRTYVVEWTPPPHDAGPVVFYSAALAADGQGLQSGSRTYTTSTKAGSLGCNFAMKPVINSNGVLNGASFQPGISPGSLISILGSGFGSQNGPYKAVSSDLVNGQLPGSLACVALLIGGQVTPIFYTQFNQLNAQVTNLPAGPNTAVVIVNPGTPNALGSDPVPVVIQTVSPALFTYPNTTSAAARDASKAYQIIADPSLVPGGAFASPGDVVTLYGTGFGATNPSYPPGAFAASLAPIVAPVSVTIGGTTLAGSDVLYAGLSPDAPGLYQFNFRVPVFAPLGTLPVTIRVGSFETQSGVTIPVR